MQDELYLLRLTSELAFGFWGFLWTSRTRWEPSSDSYRVLPFWRLFRSSIQWSHFTATTAKKTVTNTRVDLPSTLVGVKINQYANQLSPPNRIVGPIYTPPFFYFSSMKFTSFPADCPHFKIFTPVKVKLLQLVSTWRYSDIPAYS